MTDRRDGKSGKKTRRQALAVGLTAFAGAGVTQAQPREPQSGAQNAGPWTPKKEVVRRPGQAAAPGAGSSMANVLKVHMSVADPNKNLALLNEGYRGFFPDPPPARSYNGAAADHMGREGVLVQVDCVAYVD
jgi:enamine deaminase RidA (YjgF/YER057c/UK114 family)